MSTDSLPSSSALISNSKNNEEIDVVNADDFKDNNNDNSNDVVSLDIGNRVWAKYDGQWREAEIIASRHIQLSDKIMYYIHYVDFNRRMDTWLSEDMLSIKIINPDDPNLKLNISLNKVHQQQHNDKKNAEKKNIETQHQQHERGRKLKIGNEEKEIVEFVEEEYGASAGMDEESIREHEEVTKIKNINRIELGCNTFETWYYSPIPREYFPDGYLDTLYFCEYTLNFYCHKSELIHHYKKLKTRCPPGDEIYRDKNAGLAVFEVDGAKSKVYCQNLCYLAKFFLDHKTLHYDTDVFLFYVLCELDAYGYHIVGYFSKEKYSEQGNNLACILTLPPYQKKGYGGFIISFSYELSKKEGRVGSPEKPLSDLGQISYRSYWCKVILDLLKNYKKKEISIIDITKITSITTEDVLLALNFLGLIRHDIPRSIALVNTGINDIQLIDSNFSAEFDIRRSSSSTSTFSALSNRKREREDIMESDDDNNSNINNDDENDDKAIKKNNADQDTDDENNNNGKSKQLNSIRPKSQASLPSITNGNHPQVGPVIYAPPELIENAIKKLSGKSGPKVDSEKLHWAPLKVDVKRDKWSISSKRRSDS